MSLFISRPFRRVALAAALAAGVLLGGPLAAVNTAHAALACRADPIVTLSNGITVDLHIAAADTLTHVSYVLHGPALPTNGTTPTYTITYPDGTGGISDFTYVPDNNVGNYDANITAATQTAHQNMTGYLDWLSGSGKPTPTAPAQGHTGQALCVHMHVA